LDHSALALLLPKHGFAVEDLEDSFAPRSLPDLLRAAVIEAEPESLRSLLEEIARTLGAIRATQSPKYPYDERWHDLRLCLELDGYVLADDASTTPSNRFIPVEPVIAGAGSQRDDLAAEIDQSDLPDIEAILRTIEQSAESFRREDFNGSLANSRIALETLARSIATARRTHLPADFNPAKWGQVVAYLRGSGFIVQSEETGLTGVYSRISPGSHLPLGFTAREFARFGRNLAFAACYFLVKRLNAR